MGDTVEEVWREEGWCLLNCECEKEKKEKTRHGYTLLIHRTQEIMMGLWFIHSLRMSAQLVAVEGMGIFTLCICLLRTNINFNATQFSQ